MFGVKLNAEALKAIKEARGLKTTTLANRANCTVGHLCNVEAGRRRATPAFIVALAEALSVPPAAIIGEYDPDELATFLRQAGAA